MPTPQDSDAANRAAKREKLSAFLKRSEQRRARMEQGLAAKKEQRRVQAEKRASLAQKDEEEKIRQTEVKKQAAIEWRKKEKERKKEVAAMLKRKKEEEARLLAKQEKEKEVIKQKKEYMKTLSWASAMQRLKEKRKQDAKEAVRSLTKEAEHEHRVEKDQIAKDRREHIKDIVQQSRAEHSEADGTLKQELAVIDEDVRKRKAKLYAKEQTERRNVEMQFKRKRFTLKSIKDPSLHKRMEMEIERNEKKALKKVREKYQILTTELEVERNEKRDRLKSDTKKVQNAIVQDARSARGEVDSEANRKEMDSAFKLRREKKQAKEVGRKILNSTFQEVAEMKEEWEEEAADDDT